VLITIDELESIFDAAATPVQKNYQRMEDLHGILDLLVRYELGIKINTTKGTKVHVPAEWYAQYMERLKKDYSKSELIKHRCEKGKYVLYDAIENPRFRKSLAILDRVIEEVEVSDFSTMQMALF
jgi:hypothetical protein